MKQSGGSSNNYTVSVWMITYNQENFISRALESVLMQKVDFDYEIVIGEDCSTDGTRAIIERYRAMYPEIIKPIYLEHNVGAVRNAYNFTFPKCQGKYIACLEGDDYWTDSFKLQKQVTIMESDPGYGLIYSDIDTVDRKGNTVIHQQLQETRKRYKHGYIFTDLLKGNFINTCTVLVRKDCIPKVIYDLDKYWFIYDYWTWLRVAARSKICFMDEVTSTYRIYENSLSNQPDFKDRRKSYYLYYDVIKAFNNENRIGLAGEERAVIFRKLNSLFWQPYGTICQKTGIIIMMIKYFPGFIRLYRIFRSRWIKF